MINLLDETIKVLKSIGKTEEDVLWCGSEQFGYFYWADFKILANVEYDNGFGSAKVAPDLVIVGTDFWLERHEYDGSEWWEYKSIPVKPIHKKSPKTLIGGFWDSLCALNND